MYSHADGPKPAVQGFHSKKSGKVGTTFEISYNKQFSAIQFSHTPVYILCCACTTRLTRLCTMYMCTHTPVRSPYLATSTPYPNKKQKRTTSSTAMVNGGPILMGSKSNPGMAAKDRWATAVRSTGNEKEKHSYCSCVHVCFICTHILCTIHVCMYMYNN